MAQDKLKYVALGIMVDYLLNEKKIKKQMISLDEIFYFSDQIWGHVSISKQEIVLLQIEKQQIHPSLIKGKGKSKEGFSFINLYESYLHSTASKRVLRRILLNPTYHRATLQIRYSIITWLQRHFPSSASSIFKKLHNIEPILMKISMHSPSGEEFSKLMATIDTIIQVRSLLREELQKETFSRNDEIEQKEIEMQKLGRDWLKDKLENRCWEAVEEVGRVMRQVLVGKPAQVRSGVSQQLDHLRQMYGQISQILVRHANEQQWSIPFRIIFLSQVGYLTRIPTEVPPPSQSWTLQFVNSNGKFYSNQLTEMLDSEYGDIYGQISDRERRVLDQVQGIISERQDMLKEAWWITGEIECWWGCSKIGKNMCKPRLSDEHLIVVEGWHLLLSQCISNPIFSFPLTSFPPLCNKQSNLVHSGYSNRCLLITGPNGSGKTVYLKQYASLIYLAQCGMFVPGELAEIGLIDKIVSVGGRGSIYNQQAGLIGEIERLGKVVAKGAIGGRALVLIDELGAETDHKTAMKLLYAAIHYLTTSKFPSNNNLPSENFKIPLSLIITHLSELFSSSFSSTLFPPSSDIRHLTMDVQGQGVNLFKVRPGVVKSGYGLRQAAKIMNEDFMEITEKYWKSLRQIL